MPPAAAAAALPFSFQSPYCRENFHLSFFFFLFVAFPLERISLRKVSLNDDGRNRKPAGMRVGKIVTIVLTFLGFYEGDD